MLRVLTLSTLFPNAAQPLLGLFVERQTRGLAALPEIELEAIAPRGVPRWPLSLHPHYRARSRLPLVEDWNGVAVHRPRFPVLPVIGHARAARSMARRLLPMLRALRSRFAFDVIDAEFFWPDGPAAMHLAGALGVPFAIKARGADISFWSQIPAIRRQLLDAADAAGGLLAVSASLKAEMVGLGMDAAKIAVHHTGVDRDRFAPRDRAAAKARLGVSGPLLVTAGALIERKGQQLAIEAAAQLPDATLLLIGGGPDRAMLESMVRALHIEDRVRFLGSRPHAELAELLAAADVMVQPSRSEGLANVWVEALASGTPVVASDVGGIREVIDRPAAGRIVARDPAAIAAAVRAILADPPDPSAVRAASERFSWDRNAKELQEHLATIVKPTRSS